MPLASRHVLNLRLGNRVFAANLHILSGEDDGLLLFVSDEFLLVEFASGEHQRAEALVIEFQIVALRPDAITRTHIAEAPHHARLVARSKPHIGTHLIVRPRRVTQNGVVVPLGRPAQRVVSNDLPDTLPLVVGSLHEFETADEVGRVMRQIAPLCRVSILLEVIAIGEGERLRIRDVGKRAVLLASSSGERVDGIGLQCDDEGTLARSDVAQAHELLLAVAIPHAEFAVFQPFAHVQAQGLRLLSVFGFNDDAIVARLRVA